MGSDKRIAFKPILIPLKDYHFPHGPGGSAKDESGEELFVGRELIEKRLVTLLERSERKRGSVLVAGHRGVGKTSVVNRAIKEYEKRSAGKSGLIGRMLGRAGGWLPSYPSTVTVRVNLGGGNRLKPEDIFYSATYILANNLCKKRHHKAFVLPSLLVGLLVIWAALHFSSALVEHLLSKNNLHPVLGGLLERFLSELPTLFSSLAVPVLMLLAAILFAAGLYGLYSIFRKIRYPIEGRLDSLLLRMKNIVAEEKGATLGQRSTRLWMRHNITSLPLTCREVEEELVSIITDLKTRHRTDVIFVFDEIDKLSEQDAASMSGSLAGNSQAQRGGSVDSSGSHPARQALVNELLASLKSFITTADAFFFFISGQETADNYYAERGSANSLYESIFDHVIKIPSLLTDGMKRGISSAHGDEGGMPAVNRCLMTALVEKFVCSRVLGVDSLAEYGSSSLEERGRLVFLLRNLINYLAFHSWGNPKRLSSIFHGFVEPFDLAEVRKEGMYEILAGDKVNHGGDAQLCLVFRFNKLRSIFITSNIFVLFQTRLGREVSNIEDKLTVAALSSLQLILKFHSVAFTRTSIYTMSEAFNVYRSPELNVMVDDLIRCVFKPHIRRIRNGVYRYRFISGLEKEIRYMTYAGSLESASYNFSLNAMGHAKSIIESLLLEGRDDGSSSSLVRARAHVSLGEIFFMERSFMHSAMHYSRAVAIIRRLMDDDLSNGYSSADLVDREASFLYLEALLKYGDLEEHRQNYGLASNIYSQAMHYVDKVVSGNECLESRILFGDSKWEIYRQPYWAFLFLFLKRSPPITQSVFGEKNFPGDPLSSGNNPRYCFRRANFTFFLLSFSHDKPDNYYDQALKYYGRTIAGLNEYRAEPDIPCERADYLFGSSLIGLAETTLVRFSMERWEEVIAQQVGSSAGCPEMGKGLSVRVRINGKACGGSERQKGEMDVIRVLELAARRFKQSGLYVSAVLAYFKIIKYSLCCLDVPRTRSPEPEERRCFQHIKNAATGALNCIELDRGLPSSQTIKLMQHLDLGNDGVTGLDRLFCLLRGDEQSGLPVEEQAFWQSSIWGQNLAALLYWAEFVRRKRGLEERDSILSLEFPGSGRGDDEVFEPSKMATLGIRASIMMRWLYARSIVDGVLKDLQALRNDNPQGENVDLGRRSYRAFRNIYYSLLDITLISRKNLELVFPSLAHVYYCQWKLLFGILKYFIWHIGNGGNEKDIFGNERDVFGDKKRHYHGIIEYMVQQFVELDRRLGGVEPIDPTHFDYEFVFGQVVGNLRNSRNMPDSTSRTRAGILQQKYFVHDDHSDPEFRTDWTTEMLFSPVAGYLLGHVSKEHEEVTSKFKTAPGDSPGRSQPEGG